MQGLQLHATLQPGAAAEPRNTVWLDAADFATLCIADKFTGIYLTPAYSMRAAMRASCPRTAMSIVMQRAQPCCWFPSPSCRSTAVHADAHDSHHSALQRCACCPQPDTCGGAWTAEFCARRSTSACRCWTGGAPYLLQLRWILLNVMGSIIYAHDYWIEITIILSPRLVRGSTRVHFAHATAAAPTCAASGRFGTAAQRQVQTYLQPFHPVYSVTYRCGCNVEQEFRRLALLMRASLDPDMHCHVPRPRCVLLCGPAGTGKSDAVARLCQLFGAHTHTHWRIDILVDVTLCAVGARAVEGELGRLRALDAPAVLLLDDAHLLLPRTDIEVWGLQRALHCVMGQG